MAKKKEVRRKYKFPDSWLVTLCNRVVVFILRDILEFAEYGVTAPTVTAYTGEINDFEDCPSDIELAGKQALQTEEKNGSVETLKTGIRSAMARVITIFFEGSAIFNSFGTKGLSSMTDSELLKCGRRVVRVASEYLADLSGTGITALLLTGLTNKCDNLELKIAEQEAAIANRDIATEDRIEMGNAIYDKLMYYCGFGQAIWVETDEAKYNDYVIYNSSGGLVNPIEMLIAASATQNIINKLYTADAIFVITNLGTVKLMFGFCVDASSAVVVGVGILAGETKTVTAAELGGFTAFEFLNCTNSSVSDEGKFKIKLP